MANYTPPVITSPTNNSTAVSLRQQFIGRSVPNARIGAFDENNTYLGDTYADTNGVWKFTPGQDLKPGSHTYNFAHYSHTERLSDYTYITLNISSSGAALANGNAPIITSPTNNSSVVSLRQQFIGRSAPNARIGVFDESNTYFGDTYADTNGDWKFTPGEDLKLGWHTFNFAHYSHTEKLSDYTYITLNISATDTALANGSAPVITSPTNVTSTRPLITGKAAANAIVYVYISGGGILYGKPQADIHGNWQLQLSQELYSGSTPLALAEFNIDGGQVSGWTSVTMTVNGAPTTGTALANGSAPIITSSTNVTSLRPLIIGKAAANAIVYVYISGGGILYGKSQADINGDWLLQLSQDLYPDSTPLALAEFNAGGGQVSGWTATTMTVNLTPVAFNGTVDPLGAIQRVGNWHANSPRQPTGFYLPAGAALQLNLAVLSNNGNARPELHIGAPDTNPAPGAAMNSRIYSLNAGQNVITDPDGGMIYFNMTGIDNRVQITFQGGMIPVPYFEHGKTSLLHYREMLRVLVQSPQVEFVSERVILTILRDSAVAYQHIDLNELMQTYERIVSAEEALIGLDGSTALHTRAPLKFHICHGKFQGGGFAYATHFYTAFPEGVGYILMDPKTLALESWGVAHELGHQNQMLSYFAPEFSEVTNNLGALAVERALGKKSTLLDRNSAGQSLWDITLPKYNSPNMSMSSYGSVYELLIPLEQLRLGFGEGFWPTMNKTAREKWSSSGFAPARDTAFDNLALFSSIAASADLRGFFTAWGFPITPAGQQKIAALYLPAPRSDLGTLREYD